LNACHAFRRTHFCATKSTDNDVTAAASLLSWNLTEKLHAL